MLQAEQVLQGRYQLQQSLGQNAGRQTWLAEDRLAELPTLVIVKLLAFSPQMQWEELKLFEREAQILKHLSHPRIPQYRDYFSLDKQVGGGLPWFGLVQEYIPGKSLQQLLDSGQRFTEAQVRVIATQVLEILIYLHAQESPVLHRDIKPSNLIWGEDEQIYLVDFGAVQADTAAAGVTFTVVGTTGYAPLEQFWGKAVPASDLYALGATLIHLATGTPPADLPQQRMRVQFSDRVSLNPNFVRWIEAMTDPELEQRYSTATEALEDLKVGRYRRCSTPKLHKPQGSRIQLKKSRRELAIAIPRQGALFRNAIKLGMARILKVGLPIFLLLLTVIILNLVFFTLPSAFTSSSFSFFGLLALTVCLCWLWTVEARILAKVEPISTTEQARLAGIGMKLIFRLVLRLGFWLLLATGIAVPLVWSLFSMFSSGNPSFFIGLALTVCLGWLLLKAAKVTTIFGYQHIVFYPRYGFVLDWRSLGFRDECQQGSFKKIQSILNIPFKEIRIETDSDSYTFGQDLTDPERDWLVEEIQNWLSEY
jgi:serine/threonine protein kinase